MTKRWMVFLMVGVLLVLLVGVSLAAPNTFSLPWWTVDGGGGTSLGGDYSVSGRIGQHDTCPSMSGGDYTVVGGFWGGALPPPGPNLVYLPLVVR